MIHPDIALEKILQTEILLSLEKIHISKSLNRVLSLDIFSNSDSPPFDKSAMDGYAYNSNDNSDKLKIIETIPAGYTPTSHINKGECSKIMTGAKVPDGADKVVRKEYVKEVDGYITILREDSPNIAYQGENLKKGDKVLPKGTIIKPHHIGIMAFFGISEIKVRRQAIVGVITTGSELVEAGKELTEGKIYNSNAPQLIAQIENIGMIGKYYGTVADDMDSTVNIISKALEECDMLIMSGGVSMGDYDYVPDALEKVSAEVIFKKVLVKPGKPTVFARKNYQPIFGLPGNPVSTFILFEVFVKPLLYKMSGHDYKPDITIAEMSETIKRKKAERVEFRPVRLINGKVYKTSHYQGSGMLNVFTEANALIRIEEGVSEVPEGDIVRARRF
jgi:molybdopterin molybdotransferase